MVVFQSGFNVLEHQFFIIVVSSSVEDYINEIFALIYFTFFQKLKKTKIIFLI
jgi:hypothetical protein